MLAFFERLLQPFPADEPTRPPATLVAFCRHYTRGATGLLLAVAALSAVVAVLEIALFSFLGVLVDWRSEERRVGKECRAGWGPEAIKSNVKRGGSNGGEETDGRHGATRSSRVH